MLGLVFVITACFLWATDALIRYPLVANGISSINLVFFEHLILTCLFIPFLIKHRKRFYQTTMSDIFSFFLIGGVGSALATVAFTKAFSLINPSSVILLQKFQPFWALLLSRLVLKETINKAFLILAAFSMLGALMITFPDWNLSFSSFRGDSDFLQGYFFTLISVIGWGTATVFGKKLSLSYTHTEIMCGRFIMAFICLLPFLNTDNSPISLSMAIIGKISLMVFLSGLLAMFFYYKGLQTISAKSCALIELFFPFFAIILNWFFLEQKLDTYQLIGGGILLISSVIIQLKHY